MSENGIVFYIAISIHAPAKGATKYWCNYQSANAYFNPRSREGSDYNTTTEKMEYGISIHAPAKGATINTLGGYTICDISIHAPAKGATQYISYLLISPLFQSTLPRRERPRFPSPLDELSKFQSTLPRRERLILRFSNFLPTLFQSTLPRRERLR